MSPGAAGTAGTLLDSARDDMQRASRLADVEIRAATLRDVAGVQDVISAVWGPEQRMQANLLMAVAHAGGTVASALREGKAIGACVGFLGWSGGVHLHSHMAAVLPGAGARGVGYALKLWQRAVCLEQGIEEIRWTYDPLVRRNAYFNLVKLGARVIDFRPDFYGEMDDIVNAGDHSDRFEVSWAIASGAVTEALTGVPRTLDVAAPFVAIPEDYEGLRREDLAAAKGCRERARSEIAQHWGNGLRPVYSPQGGYAFQLPGPRRTADG